MLVERGDWMLLGNKDEGKDPDDDTVPLYNLATPP